MGQLTLSDIAKKAGVSKSTASRVLNNSPAVNEATRKKVLDVMNREGYSPSTAARSLSKQVTEIIGVIVPEIDNPFFGNMLRGIIEVIDQYGLTMICYNTDDNMEKDIASLSMMQNQRVRGLIYAPAIDYNNTETKKLRKLLCALNTPIVQVDRMVSGFQTDYILFNDEEAIYQATCALIRAGHTKIGILNADLSQFLARIRQNGFERAMAEAGLPAEKRYQFFGDYRQTRAYELSQTLLAMEDRPTAIISCNNNNTMGFLRALYERGESLHHSIDCIALDKIEALDIIGCNLNFIERDSYSMGKKAMEMLVSRFAFPNSPAQSVYLDAPLVIRCL